MADIPSLDTLPSLDIIERFATEEPEFFELGFHAGIIACRNYEVATSTVSVLTDTVELVQDAQHILIQLRELDEANTKRRLEEASGGSREMIRRTSLPRASDKRTIAVKTGMFFGIIYFSEDRANMVAHPGEKPILAN